MNLTETPKVKRWSPMHYAYVEKVGPFMETAPKAWDALVRLIPSILESARITGQMALYKRDPKKMTYRAGFSLTGKPSKLPRGLKYEKFKGGKYSRFVLRGPYTDLPMASGRVFEIVAEKKLKLRDDFCIEHYANDPAKTPATKLITEILVPTS
jgi:DNA gyrase inhibitor GyrI